MIINSFIQLSVWQLGMEISEDIYNLTRNFPKDELYGLISQMRRAAVSIPSNIAEGFNRNQKNDFKRFLQIANGSCGELETQYLLAIRFKYFREKDTKRIREKLIQEQKMLKNFILTLKNSMDHGPETMDAF